MSFLESLASLLFPPRCAFCGKPGVHGVCSECEKALPYCKSSTSKPLGASSSWRVVA